jgi:lysophospholipase L1-like esterase
MKAKLLLVFGSVLVGVAAIGAIDAVIGRLFGEHRDLVFSHTTAAHYRSGEFEFTATINRLGFRDHEYALERGRRPRVLAIGDSFTFGWGLDLDDTWVKVLERKLRADGIDAEVLNLGRSGYSPANYASVASTAIPLLEPDLTIVAVLQGDDFAQMRLGARCALQRPEAPQLDRLMARLRPRNLVGLVRRAGGIAAADVASEWRQQVAEFRRVLDASPDLDARFEELPPIVQTQFGEASLNPALVSLAVSQPGYLRWTLDLDEPRAAAAVRAMAVCLRQVGAVAAEHGGRVLVVAVPLGAFVSQTKHAAYRRTGFELEPGDLRASEMDEAIRRAARSAGLEFFEVTELFRRESAGRELYFPWDGHLNAAGSAVFAAGIEPIVRERLAASAPPAE